jgi:RNA polymerase sigma factor (sigma-70 family)
MTNSANNAITDLIKDYDAELKRVLFRRCGCMETAADIAQETYQRLLHGGLLQQADNPRALMHKIAANLATDYERRSAVRDRYAIENQGLCETDQVVPERILASQQRLYRLSLAIKELPPKCQQVFVMRKFEEISQTEIAERLGISRNMVEKHLRHALTVLQQVDIE